MAVHVKTKTPKKLLAAYKKAIDDGLATTWSYDSEGDFTHTGDRWVRKAWLRPKIIEKTQLSLFILCPKETKISTAVYAVYHARIIESLLRHCDGLFEQAVATSSPEAGDVTG
jgi:hypothetical protein